MGLDVHNLKFHRYVSQSHPLGRTVTIGRQGIYISEFAAKSVLRETGPFTKPAYAEEVLQRYFGASSVESIDNSDYEGASLIHDMNSVTPDDWAGGFDSVIDGGCLEHIFQVNQALANCSRLCKPGGQIIHMLPANNYCGHGFWQFSPELFFSLYSQTNGYEDTEVFLADMSDENHWFRVIRPSNGRRVNVISMNELSVLVRTKRLQKEFSHRRVQQSDYVHVWEEESSPKTAGPRDATGTAPSRTTSRPRNLSLLRRIVIRLAIKSLKHETLLAPDIRSDFRLGESNPGLEKFKIDALLQN